jgi:ion channel POLLUX/CASTOR
MNKIRLFNRIKYLVERQFVKGAFNQFVLVALVIGLLTLMGGSLIYTIDNESFGKAIWWAFLRLTDPGYLGDDTGFWKRVISTVLTVSGSVIFFGALVAILTRWFIYQMSNLEQGLTPVSLKNHFVVLGLTNRSIPILRDLISSRGRMHRFLKAHDTNRLRVVLLGETITAEDNMSLKQDPIISKRIKDIILRSGSSIQISSIHRTACTTAAAIIIPSSYSQSSGLSSDTETIKTLFSIQKLAIEQDRFLPYIIVEIDHISKLPVIKHSYKGPMEVVASDLIISRLITQTIIYPGISEVFNELLTAGEGNEFYLKDNHEWVGRTISDISKLYPKAICCGVIRKDEQDIKARLNLPVNEKIQAGDKLIWMARNHSEIESKDEILIPTKTHINLDLEFTNHINNVSAKKILILGWNYKVPALIHELSGYREHSFSIDLMSMVPKEQRKHAIEHYDDRNRTMNCRYIEADYMIESDLQQLNLKEYDSIIILSSDRLSSSEEGDARAIAGYLMLDALLKDERPQLVLELNNHENMELLEQNKCETIISPLIVSHFLSQIALRRELSIVYDELLSSTGAKIIFQSHSIRAEGGITFQTLSDRISLKGDTLLGIYQQSSKDNKHLLLNPLKSEFVDLKMNDLLIILTNDGY